MSNNNVDEKKFGRPCAGGTYTPDDPKGAAGALKAPMDLLPPIFLEGVANVLGNGAKKYGRFNFTKTNVCMSTYMAAILRHWCAYMSGEDVDGESGLSHIDHIGANCAIIQAAKQAETMRDNRMS